MQFNISGRHFFCDFDHTSFSVTLQLKTGLASWASRLSVILIEIDQRDQLLGVIEKQAANIAKLNLSLKLTMPRAWSTASSPPFTKNPPSTSTLSVTPSLSTQVQVMSPFPRAAPLYRFSNTTTCCLGSLP